MVFFACLNIITLLFLGVGLVSRFIETYRYPSAKAFLDIILIVVALATTYYIAEFVPRYCFYHPQQSWALYGGWVGYAVLFLLAVRLMFRAQDGLNAPRENLTVKQLKKQELDEQLIDIELSFRQNSIMLLIQCSGAAFVVYVAFVFPKIEYKKNHSQHIMQQQKHQYQNVYLQPRYGRASNIISGIKILTEDGNFYASTLNDIPVHSLFAPHKAGRFYFVEVKVKDIRFTTFDKDRHSAIVESVSLSDKTLISSPQLMDAYIKQLDPYEYLSFWGLSRFYSVLLFLFLTFCLCCIVIKVSEYFKLKNFRKLGL